MSEKEFDTWIRPLQVYQQGDIIQLYAPNQFIVDALKKNYIEHLNALIKENMAAKGLQIAVGNPKPDQRVEGNGKTQSGKQTTGQSIGKLNLDYTFDNFVEGKSNQLARAASLQVSRNPGTVYNPLFIHGLSGIGKTHLMQAIGHEILLNNPMANIGYVHSERFVAEMVQSLKNHTMEKFKSKYRSLDILLIDDIQFFIGKSQSQEEFFHTFNHLIEEKKQVVLTCDCYPKELGLGERLKSRFGCGLPVSIEPPELETRVAIVAKKSAQLGLDIPQEVCFYIAERFPSNVREMEGALNRLRANVSITGKSVNIEFAVNSLKDLVAVADKQVSIEELQKIIAEYYNVRINELLSKSRKRRITLPRQIAMRLAKELTNLSLPEIGEAFGRDHTTVLHACKKIDDMRNKEEKISQDYSNLLKITARSH